MARTSRQQHRTKSEPSELEAHLGYWLRFVSNHVSHGFRRKVEARGVTVSEWVVLREMLRLGDTSPSALAQAIGMSKGAVSKLLTRLQDKHLVTRALQEEDRRQQSIALSRAGRALVPALAQEADRNDAEYFGHLPPSQHRMILEAMQEIVRRHELKAVPVD